MKSVVLKNILPLVCLVISPIAVVAQIAPPSDPRAVEHAPAVPQDRDWQALIESRRQVERESSIIRNAEGARQTRVAGSRAVADKARSFYTANPQDPRAAEARNIEIFSLIEAVEGGDEGSKGSLEQAAAALRGNSQIPAAARVRGVAAFEFTRGLRGLRDVSERMDATERIARELMREFSTEPQAYEALWAVAKARAPADSGRLAQELLASNAPAELKKSAQMLLDRYALVGRKLSSVLDSEGNGALATLPKGTPIIVYSWATWGPGSLELGRMIQGRRFAALGVCLDENIAEAGQVAHSFGLGGEHLYDEKGFQGETASRLKLSTAGQIYLIDADGVISDVRGGENLEAKLAALGFRTPVLNPTAKELRP